MIRHSVLQDFRSADSMSCPSTFPGEVDEVELENSWRYVEVVDYLLRGTKETDDSSRFQLLKIKMRSPETKKIRKLFCKK